MSDARLSDAELAVLQAAVAASPGIATLVRRALAEIRSHRATLAHLHAQVDQTDPECPIGVALTRAARGEPLPKLGTVEDFEAWLRASMREDVEVERAPDVALTAEERAIEPWPANEPPQYNGSGSPCDAWRGPCSCGAWHDGKRLQPPSLTADDVEALRAFRNSSYIVREEMLGCDEERTTRDIPEVTRALAVIDKLIKETL